MKALLIMPLKYSLTQMSQEGFAENGIDTLIVDFASFSLKTKLCARASKVTQGGVAFFLNKMYVNDVNRNYAKIIKLYNPDIIMIYNNQLVKSEILADVKKNTKIVFFLGDNPLYSNTFDENLAILKHSNYTICPDTHWIDSLNMVGIPNLVWDHIGYSKKTFHKLDDIPESIKTKYTSNILFVGRNYSNSRGYRRALFYDNIKNIGLKLFGTKEWERWLKYFPDLCGHFVLLKDRIGNSELNAAINCAKVYPVDQNPTLINGIHMRVFEAIGAETLPVVEWRNDLEKVFGNKLPTFNEYAAAEGVIEYFIKNNEERIKLVKQLKEVVENTVTPKLMIDRMLQNIFS